MSPADRDELREAAEAIAEGCQLDRAPQGISSGIFRQSERFKRIARIGFDAEYILRRV
jgi:hypothetical protein